MGFNSGFKGLTIVSLCYLCSKNIHNTRFPNNFTYITYVV